MNKKTLILSHYYTTKEVQELSDKIGDSLDLAQYAKITNANRIVFAGVRFMAETAKLLNPNAEVILPDSRSTCSLVTQTNINKLKEWKEEFNHKSDKVSILISYINSSIEQKAISDIIVTSRNVEDIVEFYVKQDYRILFAPDRNMGNYLKYLHPNWDIEVWDSVCEVHDRFKEHEISQAMKTWTDGPKYLIAHPESPLPVLKKADFVGSTSQMIDFVFNIQKNKTKHIIPIIYVATEDGLLNVMRNIAPNVDIRLAPFYTGCQCNSCDYMKYNDRQSVTDAANGVGEIIEIDKELIEPALRAVNNMINFGK